MMYNPGSDVIENKKLTIVFTLYSLASLRLGKEGKI